MNNFQKNWLTFFSLYQSDICINRIDAKTTIVAAMIVDGLISYFNLKGKKACCRIHCSAETIVVHYSHHIVKIINIYRWHIYTKSQYVEKKKLAWLSNLCDVSLWIDSVRRI